MNHTPRAVKPTLDQEAVYSCVKVNVNVDTPAAINPNQIKLTFAQATRSPKKKSNQIRQNEFAL
jgi:hypothetical protein